METRKSVGAKAHRQPTSSKRRRNVTRQKRGGLPSRGPEGICDRRLSHDITSPWKLDYSNGVRYASETRLTTLCRKASDTVGKRTDNDFNLQSFRRHNVLRIQSTLNIEVTSASLSLARGLLLTFPCSLQINLPFLPSLSLKH